MQSPFLSTKQAADRLHLSYVTLERMRVRGDGPPFLRVSQKRVVYDCEMLDRWARSRARTSTSERAA